MTVPLASPAQWSTSRRPRPGGLAATSKGTSGRPLRYPTAARTLAKRGIWYFPQHQTTIRLWHYQHPRFNLGDVRLRDEERLELQKLSRKLIELKANHYRVTESHLTRAVLAIHKIHWGGAGQIPEALGQDRRSSLLLINRYFCFSQRPSHCRIRGRYCAMRHQPHRRRSHYSPPYEGWRIPPFSSRMQPSEAERSERCVQPVVKKSALRASDFPLCK